MLQLYLITQLLPSDKVILLFFQTHSHMLNRIHAEFSVPAKLHMLTMREEIHDIILISNRLKLKPKNHTFILKTSIIYTSGFSCFCSMSKYNLTFNIWQVKGNKFVHK